MSIGTRKSDLQRKPKGRWLTPHNGAVRPTTIGLAESLAAELQQMTSPVWPLEDFVAVHPYLGWVDYPLPQAHQALQTVSTCELLPSLESLAWRFHQQQFNESHIRSALMERPEHATDVEEITRHILTQLQKLGSAPGVPAAQPTVATPAARRTICPLSQSVDAWFSTTWTATVKDEIGRFCASYYDQGQATSPSPFRSSSLYAAWREVHRYDRNLEFLGLSGFRKIVAQLPTDSAATIAFCLLQLNVPKPSWKEYLLSHVLALPGWFAWARYQAESHSGAGGRASDFVDLLAIRLAYDLGLSKGLNFTSNWNSFDLRLPEPMEEMQAEGQGAATYLQPGVAERHILLRASEIAYRERTLAGLRTESSAVKQPAMRPLAQMVFCIDVRSERIRRQVEAISSRVETLGFAGFFGVPMAYRQLCSSGYANQLPVLLKPKLRVNEGVAGDALAEQRAGVLSRLANHSRQVWKKFQAAALSCFACIESVGLLYAWHLARHSLLGSPTITPQRAGLDKSLQSRLGPTLAGLSEQGFGLTEQVDMAESILKNLGLKQRLASLVVFCGHASHTSNNPLEASLNCGACGGHSGEANARFAARLLNQPAVRDALRERGVDIPADTQFVAAVHETVTDEIEFFDVSEVVESHRADLGQLQRLVAQASHLNRCERALSLAASPAQLLTRGRDWSELRPEWGLAGNAAFIVAPRNLTTTKSLEGRAFLHSYDFTQDADGSVLELIMTAPLVVAHWINMQYYASVVDPQHFSSGHKTIHNVAGQFAVVAGNGGDLQIGLPIESWHDGTQAQHQPLRLLAVVAAPRRKIAAVIAKHQFLQQVFSNQWMHLVAIDEGVQYRLDYRLNWAPVEPEQSAATASWDTTTAGATS